jgi:hypothetical protein
MRRLALALRRAVGGWPGCAEEAGVEDEDEIGF